MALAEAPDGLSTRALAVHVIKAKGLDAADKVLRSAIAYRIVHVPRREERQAKVEGVGKRKGVRVWHLTGNGFDSQHEL